MRLFHSLAANFLLYASPLCLLLAAQSAQAYLLVTYTSQHMPMMSSYTGELDPTSRPALRISFTVGEQDWLANTRFQVDTNDMFVELGSPDTGFAAMGFAVLPSSSLDISLDAGGQINAWRFNLLLKDIIPGDLPPLDKHLRELTDARAQFDSRHGAVHCNIDGEPTYGASGEPNCNVDKYTASYRPLYYFPRSDTYIGLNPIEHFYYELNSPDQWTVTPKEVPEPQSGLLLAIALFLLIVRWPFGEIFTARRRIIRRSSYCFG